MDCAPQGGVCAASRNIHYTHFRAVCDKPRLVLQNQTSHSDRARDLQDDHWRRSIGTFSLAEITARGGVRVRAVSWAGRPPSEGTRCCRLPAAPPSPCSAAS
ncbi:unnamed protein product [Pleuronectes platessa]|uniref:Uncharacterized protein n=1 Tax=Pleuronectes platessa TaxID=8262 RepID=A0A9N7V675_PLEPL|nr:unnamed protein product [Pleuronectes platessa]